MLSAVVVIAAAITAGILAGSIAAYWAFAHTDDTLEAY
jgi:hypothetical protein